MALYKYLKPFVHVDKRRVLREWLSGIAVKNIKTLHVFEDSVLGNHYSKTATEYFYMAKGVAEVILVNIKTKRRKEIVLKEGDVIAIYPQVAHAFKMPAGSILVEAMTETYSPRKEVPYAAIRI